MRASFVSLSGSVLVPDAPGRPTTGGVMPPAGDRPGKTLSVGLVNNMRGAGFIDADRQFRAVLGAAALDLGASIDVRGFWTLPAAGAPHGGGYRPIAAIEQEWPDALIITGAEPVAEYLGDEPFYPAVTQLIERALRRRVPVLFSCLASHVAILYLSGLARRRLARKRHGVLRFDVRGAHRFMDGMARSIAVPHSRWNDIGEAALTAAGYQVLAASERWGVDCFVHDDAPGCVFLQGHPEYENAALALEYRRDVRRYGGGGVRHFPTMPVGYFNRDARAVLAAKQRSAAGGRASCDQTSRAESVAWLDDLDLGGRLTGIAGNPAFWQRGARRLYANWLGEVVAAHDLRRGVW